MNFSGPDSTGHQGIQKEVVWTATETTNYALHINFSNTDQEQKSLPLLTPNIFWRKSKKFKRDIDWSMYACIEQIKG